jgi:hypothetical protein
VLGGQNQAPYNIPPPPRHDAQPAEIVSGFLEAMTATPLQTRTAREFLSNRAQARWRPERVVTFSDHTPAHGTRHVVVRLRGVDQIGAGGQWQGSVRPSARRLVFPMVRQGGQWRIAEAPNALIVPRSFFDQNYQSAEIYFFDPTGRILVPEPVHVPQGSQLASALVRALVRGPTDAQSGVTRTFLPAGLTPGLSVPVAGNGVAEVTLKGPDPGPLSREATQLILAEFAWTLRQDTSITAFTLTIDGDTMTDASGATRFPVEGAAFGRYDPAVDLASGQAYALRRGRLVSGQIDGPTSVDGPFGRAALGIGPFAVRLDGNEVAAVTPTSLLLGPVAGPAEATEAMSGTGFLRPAWDFANRLWVVRDAPGGARIAYLAHGRRHEVTVPAISGRDVRCFLVSRDGSRLVAVVRGRAADHILVSRLKYDADGSGLGATRPHPVPWKSTGTTRIRDIGWTSPTTIAVLDQLSPAHAEVRILDVDGSTRPDQAVPILVTGRVLGLATSPDQTPYAVLPGALAVISSDQILTRQIPVPGLHRITYAG